MAEFFIDVGKIKLTWRGNWDSSTAYVVDDLVWYNDGSTISSYIAVAANTNTVPSVTGTVDTANWNLFAGGGLPGGLQPGGNASNQVQVKSGLALDADASFTYDPAVDVLNVPAIAVTGSAAGSPAYDLDVTGSFRAGSIWEGANQITYNISAAQVTSGNLDNARMPANVNVTGLSAGQSFSVKTSGIFFDNTTDRVGIGTAVPASRLDVLSLASATEDDIVARFRSDHTNAWGTFIEVMPNTSQAQKSGVHLHKNSLRTEPVTIYNDGGDLHISNADSAAPTFKVDLNTVNKVEVTPTIFTCNNPFRVNGCFDEASMSAGIVSNVLTLDATSASVFTITRNDIINSMVVNLPAGARAVSITLVMTSNGSFNITWPPNTKWPGGTVPVLSTTSGYVDVVTLSTPNGGSTWYGFVGGAEFQ